MPVNDTTEKRFESDIESFFLSAAGGYTKCEDEYDPKLGLYPDTLIRFIQESQPKAWQRFVNMNAVDPVRKFCAAFNNACDMIGVLDVLRHGFKHRGVPFKVCYFMPESSLNQTDAENYKQNIFHCIRQWHYSAANKNSVDMILAVNGIPVFAFELKNQFTGQSVENAKHQWKTDRDPREICFQFNKRILAYFCVDLNQAWMTTKLAGEHTYFLPFNQGSNGAGNDGGKGNPANPDGYPTDYLWKKVFQADSMMDIVQKFISLQGDRLIFPRYHQMDVVRKLISDVKTNGVGHNYLIQHSAGSGKSNSIAWLAYRLASLHDDENRAIYSSVEKHLAKAAAQQQAVDSVKKLTIDEIRQLADKALEEIPERVKHYAPLVGVTYGRITIRNQRSKWGSCSSKGNLNFNCLLMLTPPEVIDSVVVHELCHRKEMNHSDKFYSEVLRVFPDYWKWDRWLKDNGNILKLLLFVLVSL